MCLSVQLCLTQSVWSGLVPLLACTLVDLLPAPAPDAQLEPGHAPPRWHGRLLALRQMDTDWTPHSP